MLVAIGMPGLSELLIILVIVLIFFGVGKLPNVLSQMGKGVKAFKDGMEGGDDEAKRQIDVTPLHDDEVTAEEVKPKKGTRASV